jgi:hypothetical protein
VEVGSASDGRGAFGIRDSKRPHDGHLTITPTLLGALLASVRRGDLDLPTRLPTSFEHPVNVRVDRVFTFRECGLTSTDE